MSVARTSIIEQKPIVRIEEQSALQKVEYSIQFENGITELVFLGEAMDQSCQITTKWL